MRERLSKFAAVRGVQPNYILGEAQDDDIVMTPLKKRRMVYENIKKDERNENDKDLLSKSSNHNSQNACTPIGDPANTKNMNDEIKSVNFDDYVPSSDQSSSE